MNQQQKQVQRMPISAGRTCDETSGVFYDIPLINSNGDVRKFNRRQAQRYADRLASDSLMRNAVGFVTDTGRGYWSVSVGSKH